MGLPEFVISALKILEADVGSPTVAAREGRDLIPTLPRKAPWWRSGNVGSPNHPGTRAPSAFLAGKTKLVLGIQPGDVICNTFSNRYESIIDTSVIRHPPSISARSTRRAEGVSFPLQ